MEATMTKITKKQEALLTELLKDFDGDAEDLLGKHGLVMQLKKRGLEAMLEGELTDHLGYEPNHPAGNGTGNTRNGRGSKKVQSKDGLMELEVPRDRNGSFEPQIVKKRQRRSMVLMTWLSHCTPAGIVPGSFRTSSWSCTVQRFHRP
jgi:transposase-like protein